MIASRMFERLRSLFGGEADSVEAVFIAPMTVSAAVLLVYAAQFDGRLEEAERQTLSRLLRDRFGLDAAESERVIVAADVKAEAATDLYTLTRDIKDGLTAEQGTGVVEMLWDVVYADGVADAYESNLVRRVAGLLYVSDVESGAARKRVLDRIASPLPAAPGATEAAVEPGS